VSVPDATQVRDARYWVVPIARAVVALAIAVTITFSQDHSATVGFLTFGAFGVLSGLVLAGLGVASMSPSTERSFFIAQGIVTIAAGIAAFATLSTGTPVLLFIVSAWAAITGFLELYSGVRSRRRLAQGRDWVFAGALTAVFAVAVLLIPAGYEQSFIGPDKIERVLTASVILVGAIGAYAAILGVYLAIAGLSLKWGTQSSRAEVVN
jgi:uncharacterized membrane protein HdeD (DUF308 family)